MANRRLSRSIVLQTLFEWDSAAGSMNTKALNERLSSYMSEFGADSSDKPFIDGLLQLVLKKQKEIDAVIEQAAPDWPLEKIAILDRNILRIGLAELLFADKKDVPSKVAVNEAIELAKQFGNDSSRRFVSGVLGAVFKEVATDDEPGANTKPRNIKKEDMPVEELVGAVVYTREGDNVYLALVHDIFGHWTLSKGKLADGETVADGAKRKVKEEIGIDVESVEDELGENEYIANDKESELGKKRRHATYVLVRAPFDELSLKKEGGLDDAQWFPLVNVGDLNFYDDVLPIVTNAINILAKKQ